MATVPTTSTSMAARALRRGFSLIELMVVVVILGLLATIVLFAVSGEVDEARLSTRDSQTRQLYEAVQRYYTMADGRGIRPSLPETLDDLISGPPDWPGEWRPLMNNIPDNPWGHEYEYIVEDMDRGYFTIVCYGRNGREGGEGYDEDLRRTNLPEAR